MAFNKAPNKIDMISPNESPIQLNVSIIYWRLYSQTFLVSAPDQDNLYWGMSWQGSNDNNKYGSIYIVDNALLQNIWVHKIPSAKSQNSKWHINIDCMTSVHTMMELVARIWVSASESEKINILPKLLIVTSFTRTNLPRAWSNLYSTHPCSRFYIWSLTNHLNWKCSSCAHVSSPTL